MKMRMEIRSGMATAAAWRAQRSSPSAIWSAAITCAKPRSTAYLGFGHTVNHPHRPPQEASM